MTNINNFNTLKKPMIVCAVLCAIFLTCALGLFVGGGIASGSSGISILIFIGFGVLFLAMVATTVSCCFLQRKWFKQLQQAIAHESAKYSNRSQMPCSWRLNATRAISGFHEKRNMYSAYHVSELDLSWTRWMRFARLIFLSVAHH